MSSCIRLNSHSEGEGWCGKATKVNWAEEKMCCPKEEVLQLWVLLKISYHFTHVCVSV